MTYDVHASGSFSGAPETASSTAETQTGTYRVLALSPDAAECAARQLLVADQARAGRWLTGTVNAAAAG
jgi:hypothetical protein